MDTYTAKFEVTPRSPSSRSEDIRTGSRLTRSYSLASVLNYPHNYCSRALPTNPRVTSEF